MQAKLTRVDPLAELQRRWNRRISDIKHRRRGLFAGRCPLPTVLEADHIDADGDALTEQFT
jgi:hypothetical protein